MNRRPLTRVQSIRAQPIQVLRSAVLILAICLSSGPTPGAAEEAPPADSPAAPVVSDTSAVAAPAASAFLVAQLNIAQLSSLADRIFVGRCIEVKRGEDRNGRPVQYVTFKVAETFKGETPRRAKPKV